jgi:hypothetical protein
LVELSGESAMDVADDVNFDISDDLFVLGAHDERAEAQLRGAGPGTTR